MAWIRIDDNLPDHPKFVRAGSGASWLWLCCVAYCQRYLTDGFVPKEALPILGFVRNPKALANRLVEVGLLELTEGGYQVHDYLDYNASAAEVKADRAWDRFRKELYANPKLVRAIRERDANCCRYCDVPVNWSDRRGPTGGQFDHIMPRGPNTLENVVVACRSCNNRKNNRTLDRMGMTLLPAVTERNQFGTSSELVPNQNGTKSDLDPGTSSGLSLRARASVPIPSHPIPLVRTKKEQASTHNGGSPQNGDGVRMRFEAFWDVYPKKREKERAWKVWKKIHPDPALLAVIASGLMTQCESKAWHQENGRFIPLAAKWLEDERWLETPHAIIEPPMHEPWLCPHDEPRCGNRAACEIKTGILKYKTLAAEGKPH